MPLLLRIVGAVAFVSMIFLPTVAGRGVLRFIERTQFKVVADHKSPWAIPIFLSALALGAFCAIEPLTAKRPRPWAELLVMVGSVAGAVFVALYILEAQRRGVLLWTVGAQFLGLTLMFVGALERWRAKDRWA